MKKLLIGLTGNIATGKSVVRRMLVNHGALGLDADVIAHRTLYPGGKAYQPVIKRFGAELLTPQKEISRAKLAKVVFPNPDRLKALEELIHPAVTADIKERISRATLPVAVIEAIKLLETPLAGLCQSIWVSQASQAHQMERLLHARKMSEALARERIKAQTPQAEKLKRADVVITTEGIFSQTWQQVRKALNDTIQVESALPTPYINIDPNFTVLPAGAFSPEALESFWTAHSGRKSDDLYEQLAFNAVQVLTHQDQMIAVLICEDWNFTSSLKEIITSPNAQLPTDVLLEAFQAAAIERQSELLILSDQVTAGWPGDQPPDIAGYSRQTAPDFTFPAWQLAIQRQTESEGQPIWVKRTTHASTESLNYL
jgi:dephospho-CoA kinase